MIIKYWNWNFATHLATLHLETPDFIRPLDWSCDKWRSQVSCKISVPVFNYHFILFSFLVSALFNYHFVSYFHWMSNLHQYKNIYDIIWCLLFQVCLQTRSFLAQCFDTQQVSACCKLEVGQNLKKMSDAQIFKFVCKLGLTRQGQGIIFGPSRSILV